MNLETKITIYKFTPQVFTLTQKTDTVSVTFSVTWLTSFLQCSLLVEKEKRH